MSAVTPLCRKCGHSHWVAEPCPTGDVVDARARFTIARAAAIAKREGHAGPHCVMSAALLQEEQLAAAMLVTDLESTDYTAEEVAEWVQPAPGIRYRVGPTHDDDGRVVEP